MKSKLGFGLLLAMLGLATYAGSVLATAPSGLTNIPLARGTDTSDGTIPLQVGTDVAMAQITVIPGGVSGWHSHPGGAIVVVKEGTLTVHRSIGSHCQVATYSAGQAFVERPGELDQVVNTGSIPYQSRCRLTVKPGTSCGTSGLAVAYSSVTTHVAPGGADNSSAPLTR